MTRLEGAAFINRCVCLVYLFLFYFFFRVSAACTAETEGEQTSLFDRSLISQQIESEAVNRTTRNRLYRK